MKYFYTQELGTGRTREVDEGLVRMLLASWGCPGLEASIRKITREDGRVSGGLARHQFPLLDGFRSEYITALSD